MSFFSSFSKKSRCKKTQILLNSFDFDESTRILDVGGQVDSHASQLLEIHPWKKNITVLNNMKQHIDVVKKMYPQVTVVEGDARKLDYEDQCFDIVYSNAVIEHVGGWADQQAMAREVMRVGKAWFITTPNRWYPFEFHTRLPLIGWLPPPAMRRVAQIYSYNHIERRYSSGNISNTRLLTSREMSRLFPSSQIRRVRVTIWPETLVAIGRTSSLGRE